MKPFLKWVGGKTQIIDNIINKFPNEIDNYHEIFLGGGSVLLKLLELQKNGLIIIKNKIYAYDINFDLINLYKNIQSNKDILYDIINNYMNEYNLCNGIIINRNPSNIEEAKTSKESYYYWLRKLYNNIDKNTIECSALFIILNKLCFRGLYRIGPNGFNVPFGHYKTTPTIIEKNYLNNLSLLIKDVEFICSDFVDSILKIKENDFVYLDPPYVPEKSTSFVNYTEHSFNTNNHIKLFNMIKNINNIKFIMSNSNVELVKKSFENYTIEQIVCRRAINSKNPSSIAIEVIIYN